jgi:hypothetical protein
VRDEGAEDLPQPLRRLRRGEATVVVERLLGMPDGELLVEDLRAARAEDLAQLGLRPHRPEESRARAHDGGRLVVQDVVGERPRGPVERVLKRARHEIPSTCTPRLLEEVQLARERDLVGERIPAPGSGA